NADCPNYRKAAQLLQEILRENGLPPEISEIPITDPAQAQALAFPGSPTIRVDGNDVDPTLPGRPYCGLSCRTYVVDGKLKGVPSHDMVRQAIRSALSADRTQSKEP